MLCELIIENVAVIEKSAPGGKVNIAPRVDNYPNHAPISGPDLAYELYENFTKASIPFFGEDILDIKKNDDIFVLIGSEHEFKSKSVLVASGTKEKKLPFVDEGKYLGHGLSYCALCDGHFFKDKVVAIYMGDDHAIDDALYLSSIVKELHVISMSNFIKGNDKKLKELKVRNNVKYHLNAEVFAVNGDSKVESISLKENGKVASINCDGFFPLIGHIPNTEFIHFDILDEKKRIVVNKNMETSINGLFASGDVINTDIHQIYLSELNAIKAVESIKKYIYNI